MCADGVGQLEKTYEREDCLLFQGVPATNDGTENQGLVGLKRVESLDGGEDGLAIMVQVDGDLTTAVLPSSLHEEICAVLDVGDCNV